MPDGVKADRLNDGDLPEVVANVVANTLTNYANNVARAEIDFPVVALQLAVWSPLLQSQSRKTIMTAINTGLSLVVCALHDFAPTRPPPTPGNGTLAR